MMNKLVLAIPLALLLFIGCSGKDSKEHTHDDGGLDPLAYTLYSDTCEIFVEFKPLVVGHISKFATHITVLGERFTALTEATVTVSLVVNNTDIKNTVDTPASPGIFRLELKPETAGTGTLFFDIKGKDFTERISIENVKVYADEHAAIADQAPEPAGSDITYLKEQAWKVEFANHLVKRQPFNGIIKTSGQIISAPGDEMIITAKGRGIVLFSGNKTIVGSEVNAGTGLFVISSGDLTEGNIDATYLEAKINYEKAKTDYLRAKELVKDKIVSEKDFLDSKQRFENAQVAFNTISKNYSAQGQLITSGMSGYVKNILVSEGQLVESGTPLAILSKNKKLLLQANVSQRYFDKLSLITSANFTFVNDQKVYNTHDLNGKVVSYGRSVTPNSPFIPVTFEIDNIGNLIPGSVVEVYLKTFSIPDALLIPLSSLIEEQGHFFVYVQMGGERFQKRELKLGAHDGVNVQVLSGLSEGERVVSKGGYQIKLATAAGTLPAHGHEH